VLTPRQLEALTLCSAYPGQSGNILAKQMGITYSTFRNLLSTSYIRLGVSNRAEAILKARALGLITSA
jgi:DNA-binding CsgD family transcriptional regulator